MSEYLVGHKCVHCNVVGRFTFREDEYGPWVDDFVDPQYPTRYWYCTACDHIVMKKDLYGVTLKPVPPPERGERML